jgi:peptide/nickel transport system permease protein
MPKYIVKRILFMMLTLYILATLMFFMFRLLPGDPTMTVISSALSQRAQEAMKPYDSYRYSNKIGTPAKS